MTMPPGGGHTGAAPSGWTIDTLKDYTDSRLSELCAQINDRFRSVKELTTAEFLAVDKVATIRAAAVDREFHEHLQQVRTETSIAFEAGQKAIDKSEKATDVRFEAVNEFRQQLADQAARFMPRLEAESATARNTERIGELSSALQHMVPRTELNALVAQGQEKADSFLGRMTELEARVTRAEGQGSGRAASFSILVASVGAIGVLVSIITAVIIIVTRR